MTELEQFTADSHTAPHRVVLGHLQNQLLKLGIEAWPPGAAVATESFPPSPYQLAMPTQNRVRLDQHADQSCTAHSLAQRGHDRPVRHIQPRPLDLTAHYAKLVPKKKQFRLRIMDSQPHINQIEEQPQPRINESEEHPRWKSYRSGAATPSSLPADEYVTPTPGLTTLPEFPRLRVQSLAP